MPDLWMVKKPGTTGLPKGSAVGLEFQDGDLRLMAEGREVLRLPVTEVVFERHGKRDGLLHLGTRKIEIELIGMGSAGEFQAELFERKRPSSQNFAEPASGERSLPATGIPLRSRRFWAAFLGYVACFAVPLLMSDGVLVGGLTVGLLVGGVLAARRFRDDRPIAAGLGCGVVAAVAGIVLVGLFFVSGFLGRMF